MNKTKMFIGILFFLLINNLSSAQDHKVHIAFMGNSITIGSGLPNQTENCYPSQIQLLLNEQYGDTCEVQNFAVSGRTLLKQGDFPLWNEEQYPASWNYAPDIVFIMLGTNDSKPYNWDDYGDEFDDDYRSMIDSFKVRNPVCKFIVCYPPPAFEVVYDIRDSVIVHGVIPVVDQMVEEYDAVLVDFYSPLVDSVHLFPDKIHPDVTGAKVMAQLAFDKIVESDIIHQVEVGRTYVTVAETEMKYVADGSTTMLRWETRNADSVYIDGVKADPIGELNVSVALNQTFVIEAFGAKGSDKFLFTPNVYTPELKKIYKKVSATTIETGDEVEIELTFKDQYYNVMADEEFDVSWEFLEGEGEIENISARKTIFRGTVAGKNVFTASVGDISVKITIRVETKTGRDNLPNNLPLKVYPTVSKGEFFISGVDGKSVLYTITNRLGQVLQKGQVEQHQVDATNLDMGKYFLKIETKELILVQPIIIQK